MANNVCMKKKKNMFLLHLKPALLLSSDPGRVMSPLRHPINALEIFCCQGIKSSTKNVVSAPCEMQRWLHTQGSLFVVFIMKQRPLDLKFIAYRLTVRFSPPLFSLKCSHCSIPTSMWLHTKESGAARFTFRWYNLQGWSKKRWLD